MGLFSRQPKVAVAEGEGSEDFFSDSVLGIASLTAADATMRIVPENQPGAGDRYFKLKAVVKLLDVDPYEVEFKQPVSMQELSYLNQRAGQPITVRVSKTDRNKVRLALDVDPATVTVSKGSAAELLANGEAARAIIVENEPLNPPRQDTKGNPVYRLKLTVMRDGHDPYQVNVGNGVPAAALPFLFPGSNVPVKVDPNQPTGVVVDWALAAEQAAAKTV